MSYFAPPKICLAVLIFLPTGPSTLRHTTPCSDARLLQLRAAIEPPLGRRWARLGAVGGGLGEALAFAQLPQSQQDQSISEWCAELDKTRRWTMQKAYLLFGLVFV
jgi:hypothetical protein